MIAVLSLLGQQQQFHAFAFASQRGGPFFASPLVDPLQPLPNPLQPLPNPLQPRDPLSSFRHAMPANCQSKYNFVLSIQALDPRFHSFFSLFFFLRVDFDQLHNIEYPCPSTRIDCSPTNPKFPHFPQIKFHRRYRIRRKED